ncbi:uncharacterized protein MELLADRAFT_70288 [Melampsora larici-populina 98AG31]|uniref:Uncharacterized protein n=1 Tax=Melampsora larici-populina (strain 98AG31 / pathotype 3-4-7) TaxID=747676 RepID=F4SED0_MELLP|nr:uncharacterized protein MELLADRAFT_70288 [Melampsora larici-populina 98AG31]EGF96997.1 hypothetical protein MELLADRAFT_70288 [Melampsora larici-populina 98AG31]
MSTTPNSDKFQKKIDEQVRGDAEEESKGLEGNNQSKGEGRSKGVGKQDEGAEGEETVEAGQGKNQDVNNLGEQEEGNVKEGDSKTGKQTQGKTPATRQSKRKNGQPPELNSQTVGPVQIKRPKGKNATNPPQANPPSTNPPPSKTAHRNNLPPNNPPNNPQSPPANNPPPATTQFILNKRTIPLDQSLEISRPNTMSRKKKVMMTIVDG